MQISHWLVRFIGLLPEDLELMEGLLTRLLDNVQEGRLNQADLVQMIMFCSTLQSVGTHSLYTNCKEGSNR